MSRRVISLVLIGLLLALSLISCHRPVQDGAESTTAEATDVQDTPNKKSRIAQPFWEVNSFYGIHAKNRSGTRQVL